MKVIKDFIFLSFFKNLFLRDCCKQKKTKKYRGLRLSVYICIRVTSN